MEIITSSMIDEQKIFIYKRMKEDQNKKQNDVLD